MPPNRSLLDVTQTVPIGDARAVAAAVDGIFVGCFGAGRFDRELLHSSFALVDRLFAGDYPGYLACDMAYHDLRHALDTALVMACLIDGYQKGESGPSGALTPEYGLLGVILGLLHDVGFLRRDSEAALCGPQLMAEHESRGIDFAEAYLRTTALAELAPLALLIDATRLISDLNQLFNNHEGTAITLGHMLGSADLLSQVADRYYVERCFYHLYPEFVLGGYDRVRTADGGEELLYRNAFDLLSKTPKFYERVIYRRLADDFKQVTRYLAVHFDGPDPYSDAIHRNIERLNRVLADGDFSLLRREPITTTAKLADLYHARPPRPAKAQ